MICQLMLDDAILISQLNLKLQKSQLVLFKNDQIIKIILKKRMITLQYIIILNQLYVFQQLLNFLQFSFQSNYYIEQKFLFFKMKFALNELCIDKTSYSIQDQIKGYVVFTINPIEHSPDVRKMQNLELSIEFGGQYDTCSPDYDYGNHTFIFQKDVFKEIKNQLQSIQETFSFQYDIDLITTSGNEKSNFPSIKYYINAIISNNNIQLCQKEIIFSIFRPFPQQVRQIQESYNFLVQSILCCTYGQIFIKLEIDKTDFQINDIANIQIECDTKLLSIDIQSFQIDLLCEDYQEVTSYVHSQTFQQLTYNGQQSKLFKIIQQLPIKCSNEWYKEFYNSTECQGFAHRYFVVITIFFGCLVEPVKLKIPIILYLTQIQHQKLFMNSQPIYNEQFNLNNFEKNSDNKLMKIKIKQYKWSPKLINFQEIDKNLHQIIGIMKNDKIICDSNIVIQQFIILQNQILFIFANHIKQIAKKANYLRNTSI
ncbi:hypothetical protein pb186bvf_011877 [Paramecium bursaria]